MYVSMRVGTSEELGVGKLAQFHFITPSKQIWSELVYFMLANCIFAAVTVACNSIFLPDVF